MKIVISGGDNVNAYMDDSHNIFIENLLCRSSTRKHIMPNWQLTIVVFRTGKVQLNPGYLSLPFIHQSDHDIRLQLTIIKI